MVVTPTKSPLIEAWHSGKKKRSSHNSMISQGAIRIPTPTKSKRNSSPEKNFKHVPNAMETSSLKSVKKVSSPRFATPTKASKAAAAFVAATLKEKAKQQQKHSSAYLINLISPSPTKVSSSSPRSSKTPGSKHSQEVDQSPVTATSPPLRKNSTGTPSRKNKTNQQVRDSTPVRKSGGGAKGSPFGLSSPSSRATTPVSARTRRARSPAISSNSPMSFMKSTASSRNSTYAALAASSSCEVAALYGSTPKRSSTPSKSKTPKEKASPAMQEWKNLVASITPSPPPPTKQAKEKQSKVNLSHDFDTIDLLATMEKKKNHEQDTGRSRMNTHTASPLRSSRHQPNSYESPVRKPWIPSSTTPQKIVSDKQLFSKDGSLSPISKRKQFLRNNPHQKYGPDISSPAPFAAKPAPYIASPPPAPPRSSSLTKTMKKKEQEQKQQEHVVSVEESSFRNENSEGPSLSMNLTVNDDEFISSSRLPKPPVVIEQDDDELPTFSSNSSIAQVMDSRYEEGKAISAASSSSVSSSSSTSAINREEVASIFGYTNNTSNDNTTEDGIGETSESIYISNNINNATDDNVAGNLMMMMNMSSTSSTMVNQVASQSTMAASPEHSTTSSNHNDNSFSLNGFPSPVKSAHGFPIQSRPRFEISNPVCAMLENDQSCDLEMNMPSTVNQVASQSAMAASPEHSTTSSNYNDNSFSLNGLPSPVKSAHGFPIQSKPRFEISNPVCAMLENDQSCDLEMLPEGIENNIDSSFQQSVPTNFTTMKIPATVMDNDERDKTPSPPVLSQEVLLPSFTSSSSSSTTAIGGTSKLSHSPFRYICDNPLTTKTAAMLIRPVPSPVTSPEVSPRYI